MEETEVSMSLNTENSMRVKPDPPIVSALPNRSREIERPTQRDLDNVKKELAESLDIEARLIERQMELHKLERDLKVSIENVQLEKKLSFLRSQRDSIAEMRETNT